MFTSETHYTAPALMPTAVPPIVVQRMLTGFRLSWVGVYGGRGSGAASGAGQDARPDVLPGAQAAPHEQDQVQGVHTFGLTCSTIGRRYHSTTLLRRSTRSLQLPLCPPLSVFLLYLFYWMMLHMIGA